jgi:excisionase family DNA binding protein
MPRYADKGNKIGRNGPRNQLWLVDDVAEYLRISREEVYRLVQRLEIPHTRIFRRKGIRFDPDEVERWARIDRQPTGIGGAAE